MKAISFVLFLFLFAGMTGIGYASDFTSVKVGSSEVWNRYYSFHLLNESEECRYISISLSQVNRTHIRADMTVDPLFLADLVACAGLNGNAKMNCFQAAATKYNISYAALVQDFKSFPIGYNGIQQALSDLTAYGTATIYLPLPSRGAKIKFGWNSETWNVSYPSNQSYTNNVTPSVTFRVYGNETTYNCTIFWNNTAYGSNETTANYTYTTITTNSNLADGAYLGYVNCSTPSEINQSGTYTLTVDTLIPGIWFSDPTLSDGNITPNNYSYVNISTSTEEDGLSVVNTWGLVGWWGWNQETGTKTVIDESGNGNTGNRTNMATNSTVEGYYGRGQSFDGVDDGIIIPINGKSVNITSAITIEGWFYIRIATTASLVATGKFGTAYPGFSLAYYGPSNGIEWDINNETGGRGTLYKTNLVYINTWYYIVALWDGTNNSGSQRLYVNGIQVDSGTAQIQHITNTNNLKIGQEISLYSLNGSLDEVRIYNRALSAAEINASYNANLFKYANNFTNLSDGNYSFQGYVIDRAGNINTTGLRSILINSTYTGTTTTTTTSTTTTTELTTTTTTTTIPTTTLPSCGGNLTADCTTYDLNQAECISHYWNFLNDYYPCVYNVSSDLCSYNASDPCTPTTTTTTTTSSSTTSTTMPGTLPANSTLYFFSILAPVFATIFTLVAIFGGNRFGILSSVFASTLWFVSDMWSTRIRFPGDFTVSASTYYVDAGNWEIGMVFLAFAGIMSVYTVILVLDFLYSSKQQNG